MEHNVAVSLGALHLAVIGGVVTTAVHSEAGVVLLVFATIMQVIALVTGTPTREDS